MHIDLIFISGRIYNLQENFTLKRHNEQMETVTSRNCVKGRQTREWERSNKTNIVK